MGKTKNKKHKKTNKISRRQFLIGLGGLTLAGGIIGTLLGDNELDFKKAKQNPGLRQEYIDELVEQNPPPVKDLSIEYDNNRDHYPNPILSSGGMVMRTGFSVVPGRSASIVSNPRTIIYRGSFNEFQSEDEFLSGLVDHEYEHINLVYNGINLTADSSVIKELQERAFDVNGDMFEIFQELYAFSSQINGFEKRRNLSNYFKRGIIGAYSTFRKEVERKDKTPLTKWLLENFPER